MTRTVAHRWLCNTFAAAALLATSSACSAEEQQPVMDICRLLKNMDHYNGQIIELHSEVKFTEHGRQLFNPNCKELGVLGLSIDDQHYKSKKVGAWIRKIFSQGGSGSVVIVGQPVRKPFDHFAGYFILQDVVDKGDQEITAHPK